MQYGTQIEKNGQIIRKSKNLRGILDYARVSAVNRVECTPQGNDTGRLRVMYQDGATTSAHFASYHIMIGWVRNRQSWEKADIVIYGDNIGCLTKPGIIAGD